ncbi:MAG TPA: hypothetical protein VIB39_17650 [Candidatus Angelobacter sp.]|jgi:hypothetical protein
MTLADLLLKIASLLLGQKDFYLKQRQEKNAKMAQYLANISEALVSASQKLANKELPHDDCAELAFHLANFKAVLTPLIESGSLPEQTITRLQSELYAALEAPIKVIALLERSRWVLLGNFRDASSPVMIGTTKYEQAELPVQWSTDEPNFAEIIERFRKDQTYTIVLDPEAAIKEEIGKIQRAAGLFRGFARTLQAQP